MVFKSDRQRKAVMAKMNQGGARSDVQPRVVSSRNPLFEVTGIRTTARRGQVPTTVLVRARTGAEAVRKSRNLRKFRLFGIVGGRGSTFQPFTRFPPRIVKR